MTRKLFLFTLFAIPLFSFLLISPVCADTETFNKTYQVEPYTKLELRNRNGGVTVQRWDQSEVKIIAVKKTGWGGKLDNVEIKVHQGDTMTIETIHLVSNPRVSVTYDIRVPSGVIVNYVSSSNGKIDLTGTHGNAIVETSNGKINIENISGDIKASTSNGKILIKDIKGFVSAETSNGGINIINIGGINRIETSNGSIETEIPMIQDDIFIKTSNGSLKLHLPRGLNANIELKTSNGKIRLHDLEIVVSEISKSKIKGRIGDGGKRIYGKTSNGSIDLYELRR